MYTTETFLKFFKRFYLMFDFCSSLIFFEFFLSFLLLFFLIFTLLKKNYINIYCLSLLNLLCILFLITISFQDYLIISKLAILDFRIIFPFGVSESVLTYDLIINYLSYFAYFSKNHNCIFLINYPFYYNNFVFNFFIYYIKIFTISLFILCLILGYLQIKIIKISFDKLLLLLFPILICNLILISTQDLIIAYLAIELQNLCLIFLMALKKNNNFNIQLSIRFFILNSVGSLLLLFGIILLYTIFLTTNLSEIYILLTTLPLNLYNFYMFEILFSLSILLLGLFFKLAVGPFGLWLVEIYEYSLTYSVIIFSLLPKIGYFIFLFHLFLSTSQFIFFWDFIFKLFGFLSIIIGTFGALSQIYLKRLLAFSSLNYFGYILLSFIGFTEKSTVICILYFFIYIFINFYIWYIIIYLEKVLQRNIVLIDLVILRDHYPMLSFLLSLSFFLLSGLPPFYLFILKFSTFYIFLASFTNFFIIFIFLICSFISIYYYLKLIKIINFNPNISENYKIYSLSSFSVNFIIFYAIFFLSPYFFILGKIIYILFTKLLKNYLYKLIISQNYSSFYEPIKFVTKKVINLKKDSFIEGLPYMFRLKRKLFIWGTKANCLNFNINLSNGKIIKKLYKHKALLDIGLTFNKFYFYLFNNYKFDLKLIFPKKTLDKRILYFYKLIYCNKQFIGKKTFINNLFNQIFNNISKSELTDFDLKLDSKIKNRISTNILLAYNKIKENMVKSARYNNNKFFKKYSKTKHYKKHFKPFMYFLVKYNIVSNYKFKD